MLFTTHLFLFGFLPITLLGFWSLRSTQLRLAFLALASYVFYAWWDWRFLPLMLASTMTDYVAALLISRTDDQRAAARCSSGRSRSTSGCSRSLSTRASSSIPATAIASLLGVGQPFPALALVLPIGISFYTFNSISYTIDVYRRTIPADRNPLRYATFVALFPHLIAGPIVRYSAIRSQLERLAPAALGRAGHGGADFLACGFVKKLVIADTLAPTVDRLFAGHAHLGPRVGLGGGRSATPCSSTSTSRATPTWRSGSRSCSASASRGTSTRRTGDVDRRLLAALAHLALDVPARLPLHPARRLAARPLIVTRNLAIDDVARRAVARRGLDVRRLGGDPRAAPGGTRAAPQARLDAVLAAREPPCSRSSR